MGAGLEGPGGVGRASGGRARAAAAPRQGAGKSGVQHAHQACMGCVAAHMPPGCECTAREVREGDISVESAGMRVTDSAASL